MLVRHYIMLDIGIIYVSLMALFELRTAVCFSRSTFLLSCYYTVL